jgi:hypothetical protein
LATAMGVEHRGRDMQVEWVEMPGTT